MVAAGDLEKPKIEIQVWYLEVDPGGVGGDSFFHTRRRE